MPQAHSTIVCTIGTQVPALLHMSPTVKYCSQRQLFLLLLSITPTPVVVVLRLMIWLPHPAIDLNPIVQQARGEFERENRLIVQSPLHNPTHQAQITLT